MTTYKLKVLSVTGELFGGEVISLSLRGAEGDLAIYAGHVPFITTVRPGKCVITLPDESELTSDLSSGILEVAKDEVRLLTGPEDVFVHESGI